MHLFSYNNQVSFVVKLEMRKTSKMESKAAEIGEATTREDSNVPDK